MKFFFVLFFLLGVLLCPAQKPVAIIFDTDIAPDYDDVGAMALLHAFADRGEAKILATISSNAFETTGPTLSVLNTYFKKSQIPIGITKTPLPRKACGQQWAEALVAKYPHALGSNNEAWDAVTLYRKILAAQPSGSVTIVTVGFFTNLAHLLESPPDKFSALNGRDLVAAKVKLLVSMAARIDSSGTGGYEFNVMVDAPASQTVFDHWPTPVILSGFEIGEKIHTGIRLIHNDSIKDDPVKDAFLIALTEDGNTIGRCSWDQTAVLVAVRGMDPFFGYRKLNFSVQADGKDLLVPGQRFTYLTFKQTPEQIGVFIEDLMMHTPK
jgi:inosine-uridine nucleoside N-ribohydrolase